MWEILIFRASLLPNAAFGRESFESERRRPATRKKPPLRSDSRNPAEHCPERLTVVSTACYSRPGADLRAKAHRPKRNPVGTVTRSDRSRKPGRLDPIVPRRTTSRLQVDRWDRWGREGCAACSVASRASALSGGRRMLFPRGRTSAKGRRAVFFLGTISPPRGRCDRERFASRRPGFASRFPKA